MRAGRSGEQPAALASCGSIRSPGLAIVPVVDVPAGPDPSDRGSAPGSCLRADRATADHVEIIVGQLAPLLLDLAFDLLPPWTLLQSISKSPSRSLSSVRGREPHVRTVARGCTALRGSERPRRSPGNSRKRLRRLSGSRESAAGLGRSVDGAGRMCHGDRSRTPAPRRCRESVRQIIRTGLRARMPSCIDGNLALQRHPAAAARDPDGGQCACTLARSAGGSRVVDDCRHHRGRHARAQQNPSVDSGEMPCGDHDGASAHIALDEVAGFDLSGLRRWFGQGADRGPGEGGGNSEDAQKRSRRHLLPPVHDRAPRAGEARVRRRELCCYQHARRYGRAPRGCACAPIPHGNRKKTRPAEGASAKGRRTHRQRRPPGHPPHPRRYHREPARSTVAPVSLWYSLTSEKQMPLQRSCSYFSMNAFEAMNTGAPSRSPAMAEPCAATRRSSSAASLAVTHRHREKRVVS